MGYCTKSNSLINYGYSQGGQTTVAAIKLAQSEYRGKVHFMKNFAGMNHGQLLIDHPEEIARRIICISEL